MILPTMTLTELAKEIQSDYKEVHARWTKFNPKFNKMRLKQTYYPWIWNTEIITNFSPKEWEKFLKLRGNEMWINIAIECSEFRIEHKEEYEKCSNMLQAIMDNRSLE